MPALLMLTSIILGAADSPSWPAFLASKVASSALMVLAYFYLKK